MIASRHPVNRSRTYVDKSAAVFFSFLFFAIVGTFSTTETGGRLRCNHRMSLGCLAVRWHKSSCNRVFRRGKFVLCTVPHAPKVSALKANPKVAFTVDTNAFPPHVLLVRGTAAIDIVDGVPPEYLAASRKGVGPDQWDAFEAQVRAMYKQMARIKITPLWAKLLDFQTRFPTPIEKLIRRES
jgi:hypothetical protein